MLDSRKSHGSHRNEENHGNLLWGRGLRPGSRGWWVGGGFPWKMRENREEGWGGWGGVGTGKGTGKSMRTRSSKPPFSNLPFSNFSPIKGGCKPRVPQTTGLEIPCGSPIMLWCFARSVASKIRKLQFSVPQKEVGKRSSITFFVFGTLLVTFRSLFLMLLSLFSSLFYQTPFAGTPFAARWSVNRKIELALNWKIGKLAFLSLYRDSKTRVCLMRKIQVPRCCFLLSLIPGKYRHRKIKKGCIFDFLIFKFLILEPGTKKTPFPKALGTLKKYPIYGCSFVAYSWRLPDYCGAFLLLLALLLAVGAFLLTALAFLLTFCAFLITVGKCV